MRLLDIISEMAKVYPLDDRVRNAIGDPAKVLKTQHGGSPGVMLRDLGDGLALHRRDGAFYLMKGRSPVAYVTGGLDLAGSRRITELRPNARIFMVLNASTDRAHAGKGYGFLLYRSILEEGYVIMSGTNHTRFSQALYQKLAGLPGMTSFVLTRHPGGDRILPLERAYDHQDSVIIVAPSDLVVYGSQAT
jgi:hypothetical protein